jgi:phosphoenolpyruvate carboxykinase (GTP)
VVRRDSMAMKPFAGYNFADYFDHWLSFGETVAKLPKVFHVIWFRKGEDGKFMWPGFGDNLRVIEWMLKRVDGSADALETPIGHLPRAADLNTDGLDLAPATLERLLHVDEAGWREEMAAVGDYLEGFGERTPARLIEEQRRIAAQLG